MKVKKEKDLNENENDSLDLKQRMIKLFFNRRIVEFENPADMKRCKLTWNSISYVVSIENEIVHDTLKCLRRKREDQLKMVREIKQAQLAVNEQMAKYSRPK